MRASNPTDPEYNKLGDHPQFAAGHSLIIKGAYVKKHMFDPVKRPSCPPWGLAQIRGVVGTFKRQQNGSENAGVKCLTSHPSFQNLKRESK